MRIGLLGTGMVGQALSGALARLGHDVVIGTRDPEAALSRTEATRPGMEPFSRWHAANPGVRVETFSDAAAQSVYGAQFTSAGWRLTFKPTQLHSGSHTLFVYAHSVVTGKEALETVGMNIVER